MLKIEQQLQKLTQRFELPPEVIGRESQVLLSGTHQLTVEGHRGIRLYGQQRIEVRTLRGCICIDGEGLQVSFLSAERLCIRGSIHAVSLEGAE